MKILYEVSKFKVSSFREKEKKYALKIRNSYFCATSIYKACLRAAMYASETWTQNRKSAKYSGKENPHV